MAWVDFKALKQTVSMEIVGGGEKGVHYGG
jgi:hypothetical protein